MSVTGTRNFARIPPAKIMTIPKTGNPRPEKPLQKPLPIPEKKTPPTPEKRHLHPEKKTPHP